MKAIYSRISTASQNHQRQLKNANEYDKIFLDVISGAVAFNQRPEAQKLINDNDIDFITIEEVTRLGRSLNDILNTLEYFTNKGVNIHIKNLGLTTLKDNGKPNDIAKLIINLLATIGEYENKLLYERTQQGREIAKAKGKYKGKKPGANADIKKYKAKHFKDIQIVDEMIKANNSISLIQRSTGISRTRIYRFIEKGLVRKPKRNRILKNSKTWKPE